MTDDTKPEALDLADWLEAVGGGPSAKRCAALLREQHARIAELESELAAIGAGGVQALSAAPAGFVPVAAFDRLHAHAESLAARLLAASPTPPAEQQAITPETGNSVSAQGAAITSESGTPPAEQQAQPGAVYAELHETDATTVGLGAVWNRHSMRDFADATCALRATPAQFARGFEDAKAQFASHGQAPAQAAPAAVDHDEDLLEKLYWEFDSQRKKTGEERLAFKVKMRFYASEFLRRSDGKMTFAQSVSDDMMNLADRLGSEFDDVDPRAWKHLLMYAPKAAPGDAIDEAMRERDDAEDFIDALLDEVLGHERPEWSSSYGRADALNDVQERMTALHKPAVDKAWGQFQSAMAAPKQEAQEPVAWQGVHDQTDLYYTKPTQADVRPLYAAPQPAPALLSAREIELLDGMIDAQLNHAQRCDSIPNRPMAEKQKGWDMERVTLLRKLKATMGGQQA